MFLPCVPGGRTCERCRATIGTPGTNVCLAGGLWVAAARSPGPAVLRATVRVGPGRPLNVRQAHQSQCDSSERATGRTPGATARTGAPSLAADSSHRANRSTPRAHGRMPNICTCAPSQPWRTFIRPVRAVAPNAPHSGLGGGFGARFSEIFLGHGRRRAEAAPEVAAALVTGRHATGPMPTGCHATGPMPTSRLRGRTVVCRTFVCSPSGRPEVWLPSLRLSNLGLPNMCLCAWCMPWRRVVWQLLGWGPVAGEPVVVRALGRANVRHTTGCHATRAKKVVGCVVCRWSSVLLVALLCDRSPSDAPGIRTRDLGFQVRILNHYAINSP